MNINKRRLPRCRHAFSTALSTRRIAIDAFNERKLTEAFRGPRRLGNVNAARVRGKNPPPQSKTQRADILRLLTDARGAWVPLPDIMACAAQYNARIFSLRRDGYNIENRTETIDGVRHSWFRLVDSPSPHPEITDKPKPPKPWDEIVAGRDKELSQPKQEFELTP